MSGTHSGNDIFFNLGIDGCPRGSRVNIEREYGLGFLILHPGTYDDIFVLFQCFFEHCFIGGTIGKNHVESDCSCSEILEFLYEL